MVDAVRTRRSFAALSRSRSRARSGPLWVTRSDAPDPRRGEADVQVAYAIGRSAGGAVVRNRIRRRLRELVREAERAGALAPGAYLIGAEHSAAVAPHAELRRHLTGALARLR